MIKKISKVVLLVLMVLGIAISVFNMMNTEVHAGKWVHYWPDLPHCKGLGDTCYDMTDPNPS